MATRRNLTAISLIALCVGCTETPQPVPLPSADAVESATVDLVGESFGHASVEQIPLTDDRLTAVLRAITPAVRVADATPAKPIGTVMLVLKSGNRHTIRFYDTGQNPIEFDIDGVSCVRSGPYVRSNALTGDTTAFYPNEGINLYNFLRSQDGG